MIPNEQRLFTIASHKNKAFKFINKLRSKEELCDVQIKIGDQIFSAHKVILAGCSPYLHAMFTNGMLETNKSMIELRGLEPSVMNLILDFMYSGSVMISVHNVQAILQAAAMLHLSGLRDTCCQFLQLHLDLSNCLGIYSFAEIYSCKDLAEFARQFICQHFNRIICYEEFLQLSEDRLLELLQSDDIQVSHEEQVFEAAIMWLKYDLESRRRAACRVLQRVRLPLIDTHVLEDCVLQQDFVHNCVQCQGLVATAIRTKSDNNAIALVATRAQPQCVVVAGGRNGSNCQLCCVERYDFIRDQWIPMNSMNEARTALGTASLHGKLYAVGGECAVEDAQDDTVYLSSVESYNPTTKLWKDEPNFQIPRSFISVISNNKHIYVIGGEDKTTSFNIVECFDGFTWSFAPSMRRKRSGAGVAICDKKIYIAGGYDKTYHTDRASVECFDPDLGDWSFVAEIEKGRSGLVLVSIDHYLYAIGGRSRHNNQYYNMAERYNTLTHQWVSVSAMHTPRAWPACAILESRIYIMGGFDGSNRLRDIEVYDPATDSWSQIHSMNTSRAGCSATII